MRSILMMITVLAMSPYALAQHRHDGGAPGAGANATSWTTVPRLLPAGGGRGEVRLALAGIDAPELVIYAPGGAPETRVRHVPVEAGRARISPAAPMTGNYHWVQGREVRPGMVHVASTAVYFSNPGPAPTDLLAETRSELEIVPTPLPREHSRYREGERWPFLVRWQGQALAAQKLVLETANGSRTEALSDADGRAVFVFPLDFDPAQRPGGHDRTSAPFVLWTEHRSDGVHYLSSFTSQYSPAPERTRSLAWGAGFGLFGMALAVPLLFRREHRHD